VDIAAVATTPAATPRKSPTAAARRSEGRREDDGEDGIVAEGVMPTALQSLHRRRMLERGAMERVWP
jgi:hypothetical protein